MELRDHSLNLVGEADERDQGYGIEVLPDGTIQQREPAETQTDESRDSP